MGVQKLWELLLTIAQPYNIQQLSGKVLAIDASIWIVKIDTIFNTNSDKIKSFLSKIILLKRSNILPIFVFDGTPPVLKRRTLEDRFRKRLVADDLEAKKKSEIQIMRIIEGDSSSRMNQKTRRIHQNQNELEEINQQLKKLSQSIQPKEQQISNQFLQKIALQSEILNTKYQIMLDLIPHYKNYPYFIHPDHYKELDLQSKLQYLDELEEYKWKHIKQQRKQKQLQMTQEDKLRQDLVVIQKKSIIREMQDNLFRKIMQKNIKIQNGFEIIQTIYNGRHVTQKRKIHDKNTNKFGLGHLRKEKMKNDFGKITFGEKQQQNASETEMDPFITSFCNHSVINSKSQSQNNFEHPQQSQKKKQQTTNNSINHLTKQVHNSQIQLKLKQAQKNPKNKTTKMNIQSDSNHQQSSQPYVPFQSYHIKQQHPEIYVNAQEFITKYSHSQPQTMNRDNLPNFSSDQHPNYLNASNDNIELQNLFTILGIPFLIAPGQAQAQCAALEQEGLVDGIVTEDSDTFLFGGKNVYRGVFNNNIRYYSFTKMQQKLKLTREKLIIFAELLGSDYTEGVKGIGLVNAMEILKVFSTFDRLQKFKNWAQHPDVLLPQQETTAQVIKFANQQEKQFYELHKKYKNYWYIHPSFGNKTIHNAYLSPDIIKREQLKLLKEKNVFKQKNCKENLLSCLLKQKLEMEDKQFDHYMKLLTIRYTSKRPNTLHNYFQPKSSEQEIQLAKIKSKRLQKSIYQLTQNDQ